MSTGLMKKEKYENGRDYLETSDTLGTSARTRPFSYEQIMSRRRKQKLSEDAQEEAVFPMPISETNESDDHRKDSKDTTGSDAAKGTLAINKSSPKLTSLRDSKSYSKDKIAVKSRHDKEVNGDNWRSHFDRRADKSKVKTEKEPENKLFKDMKRKSTEQGNEFGGSLRANEREKITDKRERSRRSAESFSPKRYDVGHKAEKEPLDRRKAHKYEDRTSKRRRSRSHESRRVWDRSLSPSSKGHKHSYNERDHENSSSHAVKYTSGKHKSDPRNYRVTGSSLQESSHYRKRESGLGGYSPRKRKSDVVASKIPSPPPAKLQEEAKRDLPSSAVNSASLLLPGNAQPPTVSVTSMAPTSVSLASVDSVHLTQATRSLRSLYMENLPPSSTEKSIVSSLNGFLVEAGANHVPGSQPCIACVINKEKGQAVVEFLTPEDATAALSFNGKSMSGTVLKFRRPKDFVNATTTTGVHEKSVAALNSIDDTVYDSLHKIFVGRISEFLSSDEFLAIAGAFGPVKAYHFEFNPELSQSCAFLEYADHSITQKACAGISGLNLGGQVITAVRAVLDADVEEENTKAASYSVPEHAKPLLKNPTEVLKLTNLLDQDSFAQLSDVDLEEILEDVRLECSRFGAVKSTNIMQHKVNKEDESQRGKPDLGRGSLETNDLPSTVNREEGDDELSRLVKEDWAREKSLVNKDEELERGCVLVEFLRKEAACAAAHVLHGRLYDGRTVTVAYVDHEVYLARFPR